MNWFTKVENILENTIKSQDFVQKKAIISDKIWYAGIMPQILSKEIRNRILTNVAEEKGIDDNAVEKSVNKLSFTYLALFITYSWEARTVLMTGMGFM